MSRLFFTLNKHVIHLYFDVSQDLFAEHLVYQPLVGYSSIFQPEGHHLVVVEPLDYDESSFLLVFLRHFYLIVPRECVHKSQELVPCCGIHQLVYPQQREAILWAGLVQICEVHTHPPFPICLLYKDDVGQPVRVVDLVDKARC